MKINKYAKKENYTYTLGAFPSLELIHKRPDLVQEILIHEDYYEKDHLIKLCIEKNLPYEISSKLVNRLANKGNTLVVGVFRKYEDPVKDLNHLVLHEISDMGNLGTILRTMNAFDMRDLVLVGNVCDIFNPKTIRASMGSIFDIRFAHYETMDDYLRDFPARKLYLFMLSRDDKDSIYRIEKPDGLYSLVFGNEGAGLPEDFASFGSKVFIPQSSRVDSINLPIAASIGIYEFRR
ncbi:MAG: TrmH family RNA methyltransferase [Tissierellia bacterium]|nr:TrmH family RNA methyltransferase [Tissierellia bacterium]